jgi:hypothetical protein
MEELCGGGDGRRGKRGAEAVNGEAQKSTNCGGDVACLAMFGPSHVFAALRRFRASLLLPRFHHA